MTQRPDGCDVLLSNPPLRRGDENDRARLRARIPGGDPAAEGDIPARPMSDFERMHPRRHLRRVRRVGPAASETLHAAGPTRSAKGGRGPRRPASRRTTAGSCSTATIAEASATPCGRAAAPPADRFRGAARSDPARHGVAAVIGATANHRPSATWCTANTGGNVACDFMNTNWCIAGEIARFCGAGARSAVGIG